MVEVYWEQHRAVEVIVTQLTFFAMLDLYRKYQPRPTNNRVNLEWLATGSHWQIHCEFCQAIKSVHQSQSEVYGTEYLMWLTKRKFVATTYCTSC